MSDGAVILTTKQQRSEVLRGAEATTVAGADLVDLIPSIASIRAERARDAASGALILMMKQQRNEAWRVSHAECSVGTRVGGKGTAADGAVK